MTDLGADDEFAFDCARPGVRVDEEGYLHTGSDSPSTPHPTTVVVRYHEPRP